jgi:hypothetical protein
MSFKQEIALAFLEAILLFISGVVTIIFVGWYKKKTLNVTFQRYNSTFSTIRA